MEIFIILVSSIAIGSLVFIELTLNSISHDLFRIRQILDNYEREQNESHIKRIGKLEK